MYNTYLNNMDFRVGIYIRLSQEDRDKKYESDSESVINQKELLRGYVKNNNFNYRHFKMFVSTLNILSEEKLDDYELESFVNRYSFL